jgi:diketogulonate reductase-like aldo/keto reductase
VLVPIPGTRSIAHLEDNVAAAAVELTPEDVAELDGLTPSTRTANSLARGLARRTVGRAARRFRRRT